MQMPLIRLVTIEFLCFLMLLGGPPLQALEEIDRARDAAAAREWQDITPPSEQGRSVRAPASVQPVRVPGESEKSAPGESEQAPPALGEAPAVVAAPERPMLPAPSSALSATKQPAAASLPWLSLVLESSGSLAAVSASSLAAQGFVYGANPGSQEQRPPKPPSKHRDTLSSPAAVVVAPLAKSADLLAIAPGWNLLSLAKEPAVTAPADVLAPIAGQFDEVWTYDACDAADPWKLYDPSDPAGSDLAALDHQPGFWLRGTTSTTLPVDGTIPASTTYQLCTGWNLIGYPSAEPRHPLAVLASIAGKWQRLFAFDPFTPEDSWQGYDPQTPPYSNNLPAMLPGRGYWLLVSEDTTLEIANQGAPPEVDLVTPEDLAVITQPTDVFGTVEGELLQSWTLSTRGVGEGDWIDLATGNHPATNQKLGTLDPTLKLNGLYEIRLQAIDIAGQQVEEIIAVSVEGNMKIGHFTLSFVDLAIPLSGLDIEIIRTYDSRQRLTQGDFGYGWSLDIRQGSYRNNRPTGDGWQIIDPGGPGISFPCSQVIETKSHLTVVRLSDQEVYRFRQILADPATVVGGCFARAVFEYVDGPLPGTTLEILGNDEVIYEGQGSRVIDRNTLELFEPEDVKLTTRDGRIFHLDLADGVTHLEDLNGNTLEITADGITHSSGRGVEFVRDGDARVVAITDPLGHSMSYSYSSNGDLLSMSDRGHRITHFDYDPFHRLFEIQDPSGVKSLRAEYDSEGRLARNVDAFGKIVEFKHQLGSRKEIVTNRVGAWRVLEYDNRGNVIRETDELGHVTRRTFDDRNNLTTQTDALNRTVARTFTSSNELVAVADPLGNTTFYTYNARGQVLTTKDPRDGVTTREYDSKGNLTKVVDAMGEVTSLTYDARGLVLSTSDASGQVTSFEYDVFGNQVVMTDPLGVETVRDYDAVGNILSESRTRTLPDGTTETMVSSFVYNDLGRLTRTIAADGTSTSSTFDLLGNIVSEVNEMGRVTTMTYDLMGKLITTSYPDGTTDNRSYDGEGRLVALVDRAGRTTSYAHDLSGRLLTTVFPDGAGLSYAYDSAGQLVSMTDAKGNVTSFAYDVASRPTATIDALGNESVLSYDSNGNRILLVDAKGASTTFGYDALNRLVEITFPDGTTTSVDYDVMGRRTLETDQVGNTTEYRYDALGRLISAIEAAGQVTTYTYDEVGNRLTQTDANGQTTRFEYDRRSRQIARVFPDGSRESKTYHADGSLASYTDFHGATRTLEYDDEQRLTRRVYPDGSEATFAYGPAGQLTAVTDSRGTTSYVYDNRDRLTEKVDPTGNRLEYSYDTQGNLTSLAAVVGASIFETTYGYDQLNRVSTVIDSLGGLTRLDYDEIGNRSVLSFPNGVATTYTYDTLSRLMILSTASTTGEVLSSYLYELDAAGNRTRIDELSGSSRHYTYDSRYLLTQDRVVGSSADESYQRDFVYDSVGNRLEQVIDSGTGPEIIASSYDTRGRVVVSNGRPYSWDVNGNLSEIGGASYAWDFDDRLAEVTLADGTHVETTYDAFGNRVRTSATSSDGSTASVDYLIDTTGSLSHVVADVVEGTLETLYFRADEQLLGLYRPASGMSRYYHSDGLGSVRALSDETGAVTDSYSYSAFGELLYHSGSDTNAYLFAGERFDPEAGLYYLRARWLDVTLGRFLGVDPFEGLVRNPLTLNTYLYTNADPVNRVDPTGELLTLPGLTTRLAAATQLRVGASVLLSVLVLSRVCEAVRVAKSAARSAGVAIGNDPICDPEEDDVLLVWRGFKKNSKGKLKISNGDWRFDVSHDPPDGLSVFENPKASHSDWFPFTITDDGTRISEETKGIVLVPPVPVLGEATYQPSRRNPDHWEVGYPFGDFLEVRSQLTAAARLFFGLGGS